MRGNGRIPNQNFYARSSKHIRAEIQNKAQQRRNFVLDSI